MTKRDVKDLELKMKTIHHCFNREMRDLEEILYKIDGEHMRAEGVDYVIEYVKSKICLLEMDIRMLNRTMDMEMKECLYYLNKMCEEE
ncbi:MAG: hypothetical protein IIW24_05340 [Lachnospiraceae bacterium]|nr:hypothetical protein [Lachnospiraceae bacterium]